MKRVIWILVFTLFAAGFSSCEKYVIPPSEDVYVSYSESIAPIIVSDCVSCHEDRAPILTEAEAYNALKPYVNTADPASSSLVEKLDGSHASRTSTNNKQIFLDWITAGAPND